MSNATRIQRIKGKLARLGGSPEGMAKATGLPVADCRRLWAEDVATMAALAAGPDAERTHLDALETKEHARTLSRVRSATRKGGEVF